VFDHERLDVYQLELQFIAWASELLLEVETRGGRRVREVSDQLDRASLSSLLNTAEGNGKRQRQVRVKFFDDARGSATECAACLDALVAKRVCSSERTRDGKEMLVRVVQMLTRLVQLYSDDHRVREPDAEYVVDLPANSCEGPSSSSNSSSSSAAQPIGRS
jgi:four helix bundle protein